MTVFSNSEVAMLQRVLSAYRRIAKSSRIAGSGRRSMLLHCLPLEERTSPATADSFTPLIHPPETVLVTVVAPPMQAAPINVVPANISVRSDLFGVGDMGKAEHVPELDEMMARDPSDRQAVCAAVNVADSAMEPDATESAILEDMVYVPQIG
jgi:hypothetical protein